MPFLLSQVATSLHQVNGVFPSNREPFAASKSIMYFIIALIKSINKILIYNSFF